jgi:hypothetical protein
VPVSVALFIADLRVHDNPVLQAALRDAERVVPLFVVDTGIRRTGFAVPNRVAFLADTWPTSTRPCGLGAADWRCASATWSRRPAGWRRRPGPLRCTLRAG